MFRKWLTPPLVESWVALVDALADGAFDLESAQKHVAALGSGAGGVSKVLALMLPDVVPLMPDAAIAFAIGADVGAPVPAAAQPDAQTASAEKFTPMLSWFADAVRTNEVALRALAGEARTSIGRFSPAQILDRLLWFESVGFRHFRGHAWVSLDERQAIVEVREARQPAPTSARIDLAAEPASAWRTEALAALTFCSTQS
jgi:hypothetical protein